VLYRAGLGTLLLDLLTPDEEADRANVFDIELLAGRLTAATEWLATRPDSASRPGRLLRCQHRSRGRAVRRRGRRARGSRPWVSRGGRLDLAGRRLAQVLACSRLVSWTTCRPPAASNGRGQSDEHPSPERRRQ